MNIRNFGYLKPSRLYNVDTFTYQQKRDLFINFERNMYKHAGGGDYSEMVKAIVQGTPIYTEDKVDEVFVEELTKRNQRKQKKVENRAKKAKKRI